MANDLRLNGTHLSDTCKAAASLKKVKNIIKKLNMQKTINCHPSLHCSSIQPPLAAVDNGDTVNGVQLVVAVTQVQFVKTPF